MDRANRREQLSITFFLVNIGASVGILELRVETFEKFRILVFLDSEHCCSQTT